MERSGIVLHHGLRDGAMLADYGRLAEAGGFESIWVTERYFHEETCAVLGHLAASTTRLRLGVGVVNPFTRHPALLAMAAATLDRLSGGRMILGLGRSERDVVAERLGLPYERPRRALAASVRLVRRLLAGETVDATGGGRPPRARLALAPVQARLPIYVAAIGPRALRLAGRVADGVLLNAYVPPGYVRWAAGQIREGARAAGRDPGGIDVACMLVVRPGPLEAQRAKLAERVARLLAEPEVGELLARHAGYDDDLAGAVRHAVGTGGPGKAAGLVPDALAAALHLTGSAQQMAARVRQYREAGVDLPLLLPSLADFPRVAESLAPAERST